MAPPISVAPLTGDPETKTKDAFIQQAHEARQARELARRQDKAASVIQAFFRSVRERRKLKTDICDQLKEFVSKLPPAQSRNTTSNVNCELGEDLKLIHIIRGALFSFDKTKDEVIIKDLLRVIASKLPLYNEEIAVDDKFAKENDTEDSDSIEKIQDDIIVLVEKDTKIEVSGDQTTFDMIVFREIIKDNEPEQWVRYINFIINSCVSRIGVIEPKYVDIVTLNSYLRIIRAFTTKVDEDGNFSHSQIHLINRFINQVISRFLNYNETFFKNVTSIISSQSKCSNEDLVAIAVHNFGHIIVQVLRLDDLPSNFDFQCSFYKVKEFVEILVRILTVPAIIYEIGRSPKTLMMINDNNLFELIIRSMTFQYTPLKKLTSTLALCLLANIVQLASLNEPVVRSYINEFPVLMTKLLDICRENIAKNSQPTCWMTDLNAHYRCSNKKKNEHKDLFYNPLLGWLSREKEMAIDKKVIEQQISVLWSAEFLKIMFEDLIKADSVNVISKDSDTTNTNHSQDIKSRRTGNPINTSPQRQSILSNITSSISSMSLLRRVVGRRGSGTTPLRTNYSKNSFNSNFKKCKLLSPEAHCISLICNMYQSALETFSVIRQDILGKICFGNNIVINLWTYISSLSSHNGLHAFLQLLAMLGKSQSPEFFILIFFCDCASHLISVLDDTELYERQTPFTHQDLIAISSFLNYLVFHLLSNNVAGTDSSGHPEPLLAKPHRLLRHLHVRDCRRTFAPEGHWLIKDIKLSAFLRDIEARKSTAIRVLHMMPHIIPHKERVQIFKRFVAADKLIERPSTLITIHRSRIVEDGYQQLARLSSNALKGLIRVKFINEIGLDEAGVDQDGVFKEFLEDTIKRVFDPGLNLFRLTSEQCLYPSPTSKLHDDHLSLFMFVGKMLGKAIYEGIVVDVPFALFFLSRVVGQPKNAVHSPLDELPSLDPGLYKSLTYIKHYEGDVSELNLTFSIDQDFMGKIETHDLEPGGKSLPVTRENLIRYVHSVANFHLRTQINAQTEAFIKGFRSIIEPDWLAMFSASDLQRLISGDTTPINLQDLRRHTKYFGGFHNNHRVISWLWDILEKDFTPEEHKLFLKFVTSCSKPPLLGFANLEPPFSIRCVEVSDDMDYGDTIGSVLRGFLAIRRSDPVDRLPTSSTCFNVLKLPNYQRRSTLKEKLKYAIHSNAGFELS